MDKPWTLMVKGAALVLAAVIIALNMPDGLALLVAQIMALVGTVVFVIGLIATAVQIGMKAARN